MLRTAFTYSAILALALAAPLHAQDTAQTEAPEAETPADADTSLDLGTPVQDGPALGDRYVKEAFGDWELACLKTETENDPCSLLQIMTDPSGNPVAELSLFRIENGGKAKAGATLVVPLETLLTAQVTISVDGKGAKRYNYSFCNQIGCVAQIGLTEADVNAFKRGNAATVTIVPAPAPDQKIELALSLKGFTAGYNAVDVVNQ